MNGRVARAFWVLVLSSPACSYLFVTPPHARDQGVAHDCTTDQLAPVLDMVLASTNVLSTSYVATRDDVSNKRAGVAVGFGVAALWLSSGIFGLVNTSRCKELLEEDEASSHWHPPPIPRPAWQPMPPPIPPAPAVPAPAP